MDRLDDLQERLGNVPLFAGLPADKRRLVAESATHVDAPAGTVLTREGEEGHEFIIVLDGEVEVRRDDKLIATLGPGSHFGEIALMAHRPRTATVTATSDVSAEVIGRFAFALALVEIPGLADHLVGEMASRLAEQEE